MSNHHRQIPLVSNHRPALSSDEMCTGSQEVESSPAVVVAVKPDGTSPFVDSDWANAASLGPQLPEIYERKVEYRGVQLTGEWAMQIARMPPAVRALLVGENAGGVEVPSVRELVVELKKAGARVAAFEDAWREAERDRRAPGGATEPPDGDGTLPRTRQSATVYRRPGSIDKEGCEALREAVDAHLAERFSEGAVADSVDGAPAHQLNLDREGLTRLVGDETVTRLFASPAGYVVMASVVYLCSLWPT